MIQSYSVRERTKRKTYSRRAQERHKFMITASRSLIVSPKVYEQESEKHFVRQKLFPLFRCQSGIWERQQEAPKEFCVGGKTLI